MLNQEFRPAALRRIKNTPSQIGLNLDERWENLDKAFVANTDIVKGKDVLLLDDVMTTGATLSAASEALVSAGARKVFASTLARAVLE